MIFRLKNEIANCNEWEVRKETIEGREVDCLYLHFAHYTRDFVLKNGASEQIFHSEIAGAINIDLRNSEIEL